MKKKTLGIYLIIIFFVILASLLIISPRLKNKLSLDREQIHQEQVNEVRDFLRQNPRVSDFVESHYEAAEFLKQHPEVINKFRLFPEFLEYLRGDKEIVKKILKADNSIQKFTEVFNEFMEQKNPK